MLSWDASSHAARPSTRFGCWRAICSSKLFSMKPTLPNATRAWGYRKHGRTAVSEREIDVGRVLKELLQATTREDVYFRFSSEELRAILIQLKAFRTHMPRHHPSCSNQNPLDPIGPWRDAFECDCNRPQVGVKQSLRLLFLEMRVE